MIKMIMIIRGTMMFMMIIANKYKSGTWHLDFLGAFGTLGFLLTVLSSQKQGNMIHIIRDIHMPICEKHTLQDLGNVL